MDCEAFRDRLDPWLGNHLEAAELDGARAHLSVCAACRDLAEGARRDAEGLDALLSGGDRTRLSGMVSGAARHGGLRPRWLPWALAAAALLPVFWVLVPGLGPTPSPVSPIVAEMEHANGPVQWLDAGTGMWKTLTAGSPVSSSGRIRTPQGSQASFRCEDGTRVCLNAGSQVVFHSDRHLEVERGQIWTLVASFDAPMRIDVKAGAVTPLGCVLDVAVTERQSRLTTLSGAALFRDLKGGRRTVTTGKSCAIREGRLGMLEEAPSADESEAWVKILNPWVEPDPEAPDAEGLLRYVESAGSRKDPQRRRSAAVRMASLASLRHAGGLVGLLSDSDGEVRVAAAAALARVAPEPRPAPLDVAQWKALPEDGEDLEKASEPWQLWWAGRESGIPRTR